MAEIKGLRYLFDQPTAKPKPTFLRRDGKKRTTWNPEGIHLANDLPEALLTQIFPVLPGRVSFAGDFGDLGLAVAIVDRVYGYEWWYGHFERISTAVGRKPTGLKPIGRVGMTGNTSGPHTCVSVYAEPLADRAWGTVPRIDPYPFLELAWRSSAR
jgi:murein DD-endopeptidase MepM/ murein hydrolase activator NlpD